GDEPFFVSQRLRIVCVMAAGAAIERALAQGQSPADELEILQRLLEDEDKHPALLILLRGERAAHHALCAAVESGELRPSRLREGWCAVPMFPKYVPELVLRDLVRAEHPLMLSLLTK